MGYLETFLPWSTPSNSKREAYHTCIFLSSLIKQIKFVMLLMWILLCPHKFQILITTHFFIVLLQHVCCMVAVVMTKNPTSLIPPAWSMVVVASNFLKSFQTPPSFAKTDILCMQGPIMVVP